MKILFHRDWVTKNHLCFERLDREGYGGVESHTLLYCRSLAQAGHEVHLVGASNDFRVEENVTFHPQQTEAELSALFGSDLSKVDLVCTNQVGTIDKLKAFFPRALMAQICQNGPCFKWDPLTDAYLMVGDAQMAYYSVKAKRFRHKFFLVPNVSLLDSYKSNSSIEKKNEIIWCGGLGKQGLRRWGRAMISVMQEFSDLRWVLCVPHYSAGVTRPDALRGLDLPWERIEILSLSPPELAKRLRSCVLQLASLGGEDMGISYVDGHLMGVPVLCGDDIMGFYANPFGTGLRVSSSSQCYRAIKYLLENPEARIEMGELGRRRFSIYGLEQQSILIRCFAQAMDQKLRLAPPVHVRRHSDRKFGLAYYLERLQVKWARLSSEPEDEG